MLHPTSHSAPLPAWVKLIDESGSSFANFTGVTGTWASDGTVITQTLTTVSVNMRARHNTLVPPHTIAEVEFMIPSAGAVGSQADQHFAILSLWAGSSTGSACARAVAGSNVGASIQIESDGVGARVSRSIVWTYFDTWHKLRSYTNGAEVSVWLDDVFYATAGNSPSNNSDASFVGLECMNAIAWFRRFRVWAPNIDAILAYPTIQ